MEVGRSGLGYEEADLSGSCEVCLTGCREFEAEDWDWDVSNVEERGMRRLPGLVEEAMRSLVGD